MKVRQNDENCHKTMKSKETANKDSHVVHSPAKDSEKRSKALEAKCIETHACRPNEVTPNRI